MPEIIVDPATLHRRLQEARRGGASVGFVPTMGALHEGHARLLEVARAENEVLVASIFVNPLQFDRADDLAKYPRTMEADLRICDAHGVDFVFAPTDATLYPREQLTFVESPKLSEYLCGAHRPGHFRGVATVVLKLFMIVQPDRAYFGEKDAQQLAIIRRMVLDLNVPVAIRPVATVREASGLALSSRNARLSADEKEIAPVLSQALQLVVNELNSGERSVAAIRGKADKLFARFPYARVEYFEITSPDTLQPLQTVDGPCLIAGAMWLGNTRLIDNTSWKP